MSAVKASYTEISTLAEKCDALTLNLHEMSQCMRELCHHLEAVSVMAEVYEEERYLPEFKKMQRTMKKANYLLGNTTPPEPRVL